MSFRIGLFIALLVFWVTLIIRGAILDAGKMVSDSLARGSVTSAVFPSDKTGDWILDIYLTKDSSFREDDKDVQIGGYPNANYCVEKGFALSNGKDFLCSKNCRYNSELDKIICESSVSRTGWR